jgi:hypothetical protein
MILDEGQDLNDFYRLMKKGAGQMIKIFWTKRQKAIDKWMESLAVNMASRLKVLFLEELKDRGRRLSENNISPNFENTTKYLATLRTRDVAPEIKRIAKDIFDVDYIIRESCFWAIAQLKQSDPAFAIWWDEVSEVMLIGFTALWGDAVMKEAGKAGIRQPSR